MTLSDIAKIRLVTQKIAATEFRTAHEIVSWMGAIQAQDFSMAKWAVGARILYPSEGSIEASLNSGEILRSHLMRPTWHLITPEDIWWMLKLTAPQIKVLLRSRNKHLELSEALLTRSNLIIEKSIKNGGSITRGALSKEYDKAGIQTDGNRLSHLLLQAELDGIICSGPLNSGKETYCLLSDRVREKKILTREESLFELADRYFKSHAPATLQDFSWWSGLLRRDATHAMESVRKSFYTEVVNSAEYFFPVSVPAGGYSETSVYLLPAYDEFLISYKDRSASLSSTTNKETVSSNGIFYPVIVVNGEVSGLWRRSIKNKKAIIELKLFQPQAADIKDLIMEKAYSLGQFFNKETEVRYNG